MERGCIISQHYWFIRSKNFWNIPTEIDGWSWLCCLHPIICQYLMNIWTSRSPRWSISFELSDVPHDLDLQLPQSLMMLLTDNKHFMFQSRHGIHDANVKRYICRIGQLHYYYIITQSLVPTPYFMSLSWGWIRNRYIWPLFIFLQLVIKVVVKSIRCSIKMFCQVGTNFYDHREFYTIFIWDSSSSGFFGGRL